MADPFLGEIRPVPYNYAPRSWAFCSGQILPIAQNQALFALLGTTYGGNGVTTFALPDLRGRVPVGAGNGPGLEQKTLGQMSGTESITLLSSHMPAHNHSAAVSTNPANDFSPENRFPAVSPRQVYNPALTGTFAADTLSQSGGNQPHNNMQPFTVITYIIALQGIFPPRN